MARFTYQNVTVTVNAVDLSNHVAQVTVDQGLKTTDGTAMGDTTEGYLAGVLTGKIEIEFLQDFAAAEVDATLSPLMVAGGSPVPVVVMPAGNTLSATNPSWTMASAILQSYPPISQAKPGEPAKTKAVFVPLAGTALVRAT